MRPGNDATPLNELDISRANATAHLFAGGRQPTWMNTSVHAVRPQVQPTSFSGGTARPADTSTSRSHAGTASMSPRSPASYLQPEASVIPTVVGPSSQRPSTEPQRQLGTAPNSYATTPVSASASSHSLPSLTPSLLQHRRGSPSAIYPPINASGEGLMEQTHTARAAPARSAHNIHQGPQANPIPNAQIQLGQSLDRQRCQGFITDYVQQPGGWERLTELERQRLKLLCAAVDADPIDSWFLLLHQLLALCAGADRSLWPRCMLNIDALPSKLAFVSDILLYPLKGFHSRSLIPMYSSLLDFPVNAASLDQLYQQSSYFKSLFHEVISCIGSLESNLIHLTQLRLAGRHKPTVSDVSAFLRIKSSIFHTTCLRKFSKDLGIESPQQHRQLLPAPSPHPSSNVHSTRPSRSPLQRQRPSSQQSGPLRSQRHHYPLAQASAAMLSPRVPTIPQPRRAFYIRPSFSGEQVAPANPSRYAMHQAVAKSPQLRLSSLVSERMYQFPQELILGLRPLNFVKEDYESSFNISDDLMSRIPRTVYNAAQGLDFRELDEASLQVRLRCLKNVPNTDLSHALLSDCDIPANVFFKCNETRLQPRLKLHWGRDLSFDITNAIKPGVNTIKAISNRSAKQASLQSYTISVDTIALLKESAVKQQAKTIPAEQSRQETLRVLTATNDDDDLMCLDTSITIDLIDPIKGTEIWKTPARSAACLHRNCFDLDTFLQARKDKGAGTPTIVDHWLCPICRSDARPPMLVIDGWMVEIRGELERTGQLDARALEVQEDGTWRAKMQGDSGSGVPRKAAVSVDLVDD